MNYRKVTGPHGTVWTIRDTGGFVHPAIVQVAAQTHRVNTDSQNWNLYAMCLQVCNDPELWDAILAGDLDVALGKEQGPDGPTGPDVAWAQTSRNPSGKVTVTERRTTPPTSSTAPDGTAEAGTTGA